MRTIIFIILGVAFIWIALEGISAIIHAKNMPENYEENIKHLSKKN